MIAGFFGDLGSGKTLSMTRYGYYYYLAGYKIFANYGLSFPHTKVTSEFLESVVKENPDLPELSVFMMDEFDMFVDSRQGMKKRNQTLGYFLKQIRKKNIVFLYSAQLEHTIDKRIRGITRTEVFCESKKIVIKRGNSSNTLTLIVNEIWILRKLKMKKQILANPYFKLFDTKELITVDE